LRLKFVVHTLSIQKGSVYVSDYELTKESPLRGAEHEFDGVTVAEVTDQSLVMVALPRDRADDI